VGATRPAQPQRLSNTRGSGIAGQLVTAIADRDTCPDLEVFAQGVRDVLDDLTRSLLVAAS
jgi:hypothetical protein